MKTLLALLVPLLPVIWIWGGADAPAPDYCLPGSDVCDDFEGSAGSFPTDWDSLNNADWELDGITAVQTPAAGSTGRLYPGTSLTDNDHYALMRVQNFAPTGATLLQMAIQTYFDNSASSWFNTASLNVNTGFCTHNLYQGTAFQSTYHDFGDCLTASGVVAGDPFWMAYEFDVGPSCCSSNFHYDMTMWIFNANDFNVAPVRPWPTTPNGSCTGAGVPYTCCTGAGAGTCRMFYGAVIDAEASSVVDDRYTTMFIGPVAAGGVPRHEIDHYQSGLN